MVKIVGNVDVKEDVNVVKLLTFPSVLDAIRSH